MRLRSLIRIFILVLITMLQCPFFALSQSASLSFFDDVARGFQLNSRWDSLLSFCVRPNYNSNDFYFDSTISQNVRRAPGAKSILTGSTELLLLPITLQQQYNTHRPYGWN